MIRRRVRVHGQVQGVFFRSTCRDLARSIGVSGWVRNEPDGSVLAVFEGPPDLVDRMCRWCERGPDHAWVSNVEVVEEQPEGLSSFRISY